MGRTADFLGMGKLAAARVYSAAKQIQAGGLVGTEPSCSSGSVSAAAGIVKEIVSRWDIQLSLLTAARPGGLGSVQPLRRAQVLPRFRKTLWPYPLFDRLMEAAAGWPTVAARDPTAGAWASPCSATQFPGPPARTSRRSRTSSRPLNRPGHRLAMLASSKPAPGTRHPQRSWPDRVDEQRKPGLPQASTVMSSDSAAFPRRLHHTRHALRCLLDAISRSDSADLSRGSFFTAPDLRSVLSCDWPIAGLLSFESPFRACFFGFRDPILISFGTEVVS
jgi:hypothetical protein